MNKTWKNKEPIFFPVLQRRDDNDNSKCGLNHMERMEVKTEQYIGGKIIGIKIQNQKKL